MLKQDLEKVEELEIKLPRSIGSQKKQESSRKTSTSASLTMLKPLTVWITANWVKEEGEMLDHLTCLLRHLYAGQEAWLEPNMEQWTGSKFGKKYKSMYCHPAHLTSMQSTS